MLLKSASSIAALAMIFAAAPALATDLSGRGEQLNDYPIERNVFQGFGVGVHGGGQFTNIDIMDQFDGIGADGLVGGIHAEYLFGFGSLRVGPYIEGGISNVNTEIQGQDLINQDHYYGGGIKAGAVVWNSTLVYGKLGYEWSKWSILDDEADADVESVVLGAGIETMLMPHVSLGLEASYITPLNIEVEGDDITDLLEESESLRVIGKVSWRQ
jgi:opacity protein-like surface antigen